MRKVLLILIGIGVGIYLLLGLPPIQRMIIEIGGGYLKKNLGVELDFARVSGHLLHHLHLSRLRVGNILRIGELDIRYDPLSIISGRIRRITIDGFEVDVDAVLNLRPGKDSGPPPIELDALTIKDGLITYRNYHIPFCLRIGYRKGRLRIDTLRISSPDTKITLQGIYEPEGSVDLSYRVDLLDGRLRSTGVVRGRGDRPIISGRLSYSSPPDCVDLEYRYREGVFSISPISLRSGDHSATGRASYQMDLDRLRLHLRGEGWQLKVKGSLRPRINILLEGEYQEAEFRGRFDYDRNLNGELSIRFKPWLGRVGIHFDPTIKKGYLRAKLSHPNLQDIMITSSFDQKRMGIAISGPVDGRGTITLAPPYPIRLHFWAQEFGLSGLIAGELAKNLRIRIDHLRREELGHLITITEPICLSYQDSTLRITRGELVIDQGSVRLQGMIQPLDLNLTLSHLDLGILSRFLPDHKIEGDLSGEIRLFGQLPRPLAQGHLEFDPVVIVSERDTIGPITLGLKLDRDIIMIDTLKINYRGVKVMGDGITAEIDSLLNLSGRILVEGNPVDFSGQIPLGQDAGLNLTITADSIDLVRFNRLLPAVVERGIVSAHLLLSGKMNHPQISGRFRPDSVVVIYGDTIGPISGRVSYGNGIIIIDSLMVDYRKGKILFSGDLGKGIAVNIDGLRFPIGKSSYSTLDGQIRVAGPIDSLRIKGELAVEGEYSDPIDIALLTRTNRPMPKFLSGLQLDLGIKLKFWVRNEVAQLLLLGDLEVKGSPSQPGVVGRVLIESGGRVHYLGRSFTIEYGAIDLTDPHSIAPELDLIGRTTIRYQEVDYTIQLKISGSPQNLVIGLTSDPPLPRPEIIALLITGKTRGMIRIPEVREVGEKAVAYLLEKIKDDIESRTARALGLEEITLSRERIGLRKRIYKKAILSYSTGFESWEEQVIGIDYEINPNLSIYSTYDMGNRDTGGGLDLHLELW